MGLVSKKYSLNMTNEQSLENNTYKLTSDMIWSMEYKAAGLLVISHKS